MPNILVVDDEIDSLEVLTFVLEQEGAKVTPLTSAQQALKTFCQLSPDLIISDLEMPQTDGYTLITQIRQLPQGKNVPAIAITAYAGDSDKKRTIDAGFQQHIPKPINIPNLISTISLLI